MVEAVILTAIESLDCWLLKKGVILEDNKERLYNLIVGMSDLGEEKKKMVHSLLLQFGMMEEDAEEEEEVDEIEEEEEDQEEVDQIEEEDEEEQNKKKMYNLLDLNKEKMYSLVVGMADFWKDNKERLYYLLFRVAEGVENIVLITRDRWGGVKKELDKEKLHNLVVEIVDLWDDDEREVNKEELHSLLLQLKYSTKNMRRLSDEVSRLWKYKQPKLNKEKLYTWLANKVAPCDDKYLFQVLFDMVLLYDSSDFKKSTRERVEGIKEELEEIVDLITDKKLGDESCMRYFISDVVDMAHRTGFLIRLQDSDPLALLFQISILQDYAHKTYHEWFDRKFKRILNGLQEIKVSMLGFKVERLQYVKQMEGSENVVGLEDDVKLLLYDDKTTVITGMVGIGKTTLARQLYNHETITQQFERRAWICLSKVFSRKEMLVSLIRQMVDSSQLASLAELEHADYKSLKQVLRQLLLKMRYFIVLDDVSYNTTHLEYVKKALPKDKLGSRLLLTTRSVKLKYKSFHEVYHHMKPMDDDKSWTLLLKSFSIEGSNEEFPKHLVKKAKQILRKCGGLPLAIKEVGRKWVKRRQSGSEWEELIESIDLTETLGTLESAYHDWDRQLQSRFLHLAFFQEGAHIRAKRLVHIWMVMGVVSGFKEDHKRNLRELFSESIIDIDMDATGNIKTCCVQVVFHMLSIRKAEDELRFEIVREDGNNRPSHHRAIYCSRDKLMNYSSNQDKNLLSLFFYGGGYFNASPSYWKHFEQLKTLDMEDFGLKVLPVVIGMLTDLRYLGLRNNCIQELPYSLNRLKKLEVLDIALNFMIEVEDIICEMESLRHLYMSDISCRKPLKIDTLKNLETWTYISVHNWIYEASRLEMMRSLTKLGIQELDENTDANKFFASLAELKNLECLILRGFRFKSMPSLDEIGILHNLYELKLDGLLTRLPSANNFPRGIGRLSLVNSCLHEDPMPMLEKLSYLTYLKLQNAYTGEQMVISRNGFSSLLVLVIEELWHLTNIKIEKNAMDGLAHLEINSCSNLETFPKEYVPDARMLFKMKTTKRNATKIRKSNFIYNFRNVDIHP